MRGRQTVAGSAGRSLSSPCRQRRHFVGIARFCEARSAGRRRRHYPRLTYGVI